MNYSMTSKRIALHFRLLSRKMVAGLRGINRLSVGIFALLLSFSGTELMAQEVDLSTLPNDEIRVLIVGDSLSAGYGLKGPNWVDLANLEFSDAGKKITIINDSISGDTTAGGVARIQGSIERANPNWIMIQLGGNDGLRGLSPKTIENNLLKMVEASKQEGVKTMLLGIRIPPNYGRSYTQKFEQVFVNVAEKTDTPLFPFFIGRVGGDPTLNQADQIHPNDDAQPIIRDLVLNFMVSVLAK